MNIRSEELADNVTIIRLIGRMDSIGGHEVNARLAALIATVKRFVVIDLSEVSFLASIGIRTLIVNARAQSLRGGMVALANPQPMVGEVLTMAGIDTIIPLYADVYTAHSALLERSRNRA